MELEIGLKFFWHKIIKRLCTTNFKSDISCSDFFGLVALNDFGKMAYAQKVLTEEIEEALKRANDRLLADGFGEEDFRLPCAKGDAD